MSEPPDVGASGPSAPGSSSQPSSPEEAVLAIQRHRAAIVEAQHRVLRHEITMPQYNAVYKEHLDAIHALEAWLHDFQLRGMGGSAAGLY